MTPAETTIRNVLWWAVLVSCHALHAHAHAHAHAEAADHRSIDKSYKRLAVKSNTTGAIESTSLSHHSSVAISSALPSTSTSTPISTSISTITSTSTSTGEDVLPPHVSSDAVSDTSSAIPEDSYSSVEQASIATSTDTDDGGFSAAGAQNSDARALGGTFIANITTFARTPLARPTSLANQPISTNLPFPIFSLNTTNNATTTSRGPYSNSSITPPPITGTEPPTPTTTEDYCTTNPYDLFSTVIEYSIVHTWTITWYGDPADYTPPFPPISIPTPCTPTPTSATGRFTISVCDSSGQSCSLIHTTGDVPAAPSPTTGPWWVWLTDSSAVRGMEPTLTFVTTDKNPAVVFPTSSPPDYGGSPDAVGNVHSAAYPNEAQSPDAPGYGNDEVSTNQNIRSVPLTSVPPVTVIVKPSVVVIDDQTFTNNPTQPTSTVVVDGNSFTINPTQVVGVGATITRPPESGLVASQRPPTITTVGDIGVDIEDSSVILDRTTFTIGPRPTTVVVKGQTITLGPGAIAFPSQTLAIPAARDTTQVVFGAELITAIGTNRVVIEGHTITYGPGTDTITEVIDGDTILIGPSGIVVHGETYGGINAAATATQFAVVGGVTISQVGSTALVIHGVTYTFDPVVAKQTKTTTVLGGETVTIGPDGVSIETWTLDPPYASTTTITPANGAARALPTATATAANTSKQNSSSSSSLVARRPRWALTACIAAGASIFGARLL
ncbi:hypothetical protein F5Y10DRAFT_228210 [Nemania abortiva]|nr:hypothetical protein F5Y10DRAFT_228210 [Nemania abortiva]